VVAVSLEIRLRKKFLTESDRKRASRAA
jgi:predicted membrane GTPase involved in stress response